MGALPLGGAEGELAAALAIAGALGAVETAEIGAGLTLGLPATPLGAGGGAEPQPSEDNETATAREETRMRAVLPQSMRRSLRDG